MIRLYRIPLSTNVERVSLALAHKGLAVEHVDVDPDDRSEVSRISGQERVPVIDDGGEVVADSTTIIRYLDERYPDRPLFPRDDPARAEVLLFCGWFDGFWKRAVLHGLAEQFLFQPEPDEARVEKIVRAVRESHALLEGLLAGREYLFGDFSAADCLAFPFVKFAVLWDDEDKYRLHILLRDYQQLDGSHPRLREWIQRVDELPRA